MATVELANLTKIYDPSAPPAVDSVDLAVADGEFMVLLGPSGCGKSTTLRMIAGLERASSGTIAIDGSLVNRVPAKDRDIAMVFQSYALYPHMSVADNIAFGLRRRGVPKAEVHKRVADVAEILDIETLLQRKPKALSGGQRQRVALGRAIVRNPKVFLFDEPLSNLDAGLRVTMRNEIIRLYQRLRATVIYVTHDQVEAMTMGSRICIMRDGRVEQIGKPLDVYDWPENTFVARFLGNPPMNLLPSRILDDDNAGSRLRIGTSDFRVPGFFEGNDTTETVVGIRPEDVGLGAGGDSAAPCISLACDVQTVEPLGAETMLRLQVDGLTAEICVKIGRSMVVKPGERTDVHMPVSAIRWFDAQSGRRVQFLQNRHGS